MRAPLVFMDTETTGLAWDADIWEYAGIRREPDGTVDELHLFIEHDEKCEDLPEPFLSDHLRRYVDAGDSVVSKWEAAHLIHDHMLSASSQARTHVVGAVPNFDTEKIHKLMRDQLHPEIPPPWHHHLIDVENLAAGFLIRNSIQMYIDSDGDDALVEKAQARREAATPPWSSDDLSRLLGVEPPGDGVRHTAMGDARWVMALYDRITG